MQVLKDEVRKSIIDAAIKTFTNNGYQKASMRRIAEEAGMSVGNLYRYYANKETLMGAIVQPMIDVFQENQANGPAKMKLEMLDVNLLEHSIFIEQLMEARMDFKDELFILFLRAEGSPYEGARETLGKFLEDKTVEFLQENSLDETVREGERAFIKIAAASIVEGFCTNLEISESETDFLMNMLRFTELIIKPSIRNLMALRDNNTTFRRISDEEILRHFSHHRSNCHHRSTEGTDNHEPGSNS